MEVLRPFQVELGPLAEPKLKIEAKGYPMSL